MSLGDRWRADPATGRPLLTLRRIYALVWRNPGPAVLAASHGSVPWTRQEHLLDELRRTQLLTHGVKDPKPFPGRVHQRKKSDDIEKRRAVNRERAARRRRELEEMG